MHRLPFSTQLRLALLLPAFVALAAAAVPFWSALVSAFERNSVEHLTEHVATLGELLRPDLDLPPEELQHRIEAISDDTELRLTIIAEDGRVLADSARTGPQVQAMDNHAGRPEVAAALAEGIGSSSRQSDTTGLRYVYVARLTGGSGATSYIVRIAAPLATLGAVRIYLARLVTAAAVAVILLAALASWLVGRRLFEPLARLSTAADHLDDGDGDYRIPVPDTPELAKLARSMNRMADRVAVQLAMSEAERRHLDDVLESMTDGVLVIDRDGLVRSANPSLRRLFDVDADPAGRLVLELTRQPRIEELVEKTLSDGGSGEIQIEIGGPPPRTGICACSPLSGGGGAVVVVRDITDSTRVHAMRREFVANVSHELRTPLTAIRGYAETLGDGAIDDRGTAVRFVDRILRQCRRLQALLDDLLTLSRLESADVAAELQPVDLAEVLRDAAELVGPKSIEKKVIVRIETDEIPSVLGDPTGLERVCSNLLENAIKYNRPGGEVTGRVRSDGSSVILEVTDTGIGIPREAQARVFERFYRVDTGRARDEGGTGLGLAIVKHVTQLHRGRVEVESVPGEGTTFRVRLPATPQTGPRDAGDIVAGL